MSSDQGAPDYAKIWGAAIVGGWVALSIFAFVLNRFVPYHLQDQVTPHWPVIRWLLLFVFVGGIGAILTTKGVFHEGGGTTPSPAMLWGAAIVGGWIGRSIFVDLFFWIAPYQLKDMVIPHQGVLSWLLLFVFVIGIGALMGFPGVFVEDEGPPRA
jgi:hypothetical protein